MVKSSSTPAAIDIADHTIVLRVWFRVDMTYSCFLASSVAHDWGFDREHRRETCFSTWFRWPIVYSTTTIVFLIFFSIDWYQPRIRGCPVAAAPSSSDRRRQTAGRDDVAVGSPHLFDFVVALVAADLDQTPPVCACS
jgi:hypothetical protein